MEPRAAPSPPPSLGASLLPWKETAPTHRLLERPGRLGVPAAAIALGAAVFGLSQPPVATGHGESHLASAAVERTGDGVDTLVVSYWVEPRGMSFVNPARQLLFEPLFRGSYTRPGEVVGALVTGWEPSEDYRTWTYHLRSDVLWHDGMPVTAEDVKFTEDLRQHPEVGVPDTREVRVLNDTTVEITYLVPMNPTPWRGVLPKHLLEHLDPGEYWDWGFWDEPVGNGPYRYARHSGTESIELEANPDYYKGRPEIDRVIFKYDDVWGTVDSVKSGVDAFGAPVFLASDFPSLSPDYRVYSWEQPVTGTAVGWNHRRSVLADASVRRALTMAIDRHELARLRGFPEWAHARDVLTPQYPAGFDRGPATVFDAGEARRTLTRAGWVDDDGDGVREREGEEFSFTLMVSDAAQDLEIARRVRRYLADVGVSVNIDSVASARLVRDAFRSGEVDAAMFRVSLSSVAGLFGADSPVGFDDLDLTRRWEAANASWDPEERSRHLNQVMKRFRELLPVTVLLLDVQSSVAHRRVKGLLSPDKGDVVEFLSELWIEEDGETGHGQTQWGSEGSEGRDTPQ